MAGLDLGHVLSLLTGAERIHASTLRRFAERFARFNLPDTALRPAYGLAEATVYVASALPGRPLPTARFSYEKLSGGYAERCADEGGVELISHGPPRSCTVRIVDPDTCTENPDGKVGEIWVHGDNVAAGYWRNPQQSELTFGGSSSTRRRTRRRALASDRRPRCHIRRRTLHRRPDQGSADRGWA